MSRWWWSLVLLVACPGKPDDADPDTDDPDAVDTDTDTDVGVDSDTDTDSDAPGPTGDTAAVDTAPPTAPPASEVVMTATPVEVCMTPELRDDRSYDPTFVSYPSSPQRHLEGSGSVVADLDGNGLLDVVVVSWDRVLLFDQEQPRDFTRQTLWQLEEGVGGPVAGLFGATAADGDDDGDLDLLITGRAVPNRLLRNDGGMVFTDVTTASGLDVIPDGHHTAGSSWVDLDDDGDLDLFVAGHGYVDEEGRIADFEPADRSWVFRNEGGGTFVDITDGVFPSDWHAAYSFLGGFLDADGDGDEDLYLVNDFGGAQLPNEILWNTGGVFAADDGSAGLTARFAGMGLGLGDLDGDGTEDIAVPAWADNALFLNVGGLWAEASAARGWRPGTNQTVGWSATPFDADNDGDLDLGTAYGRLDTNFGANNVVSQPDALHLQTSTGTFVEVAPAAGLASQVPHRSWNVGDLDGDGWLDVVRVGLEGEGRIDWARCGEAGWVTVALRQPAPNTHGVGATVRVRTGATWQVRRLRAGGEGYAMGRPMRLHFGLGVHRSVDELRVTWPDGTEHVWRDVLARRHLTLTRP